MGHGYRHWPRPLGPRQLPRLPPRELAEDEDPTAPADKYTHRTPRIIRFCLIGLAVVNALTLVAVVLFIGYVLDLAEYRNGEQERTRESFCRLLDTLPDPEGEDVLTPAREMNRCGPGLPVSDLPPEVRQRFQASPWSASPQVIERDDPARADRARERPGQNITGGVLTPAEPPSSD